MRGAYEPGEILFNILEKSNIAATIKPLLFLCPRMHPAFMAKEQVPREVMKLSCGLYVGVSPDRSTRYRRPGRAVGCAPELSSCRRLVVLH